MLPASVCFNARMLRCRHLAKNTAQTGAIGRLELAVGCQCLLRVQGLTVTLRGRTTIKALFLCFGLSLVHVGILYHEYIHHILFSFLSDP